MSLCRCTATASPWGQPSPFPAPRVTTSPAPSKSLAFPQVSLLCRPLLHDLFFSASVGYSKIFLLCMCFSLFVSVHQVHLSPTKECICKSRSVTNCLRWPVTYRLPLPRRPRGVVQRCPAVPGRALPRSCHGRAESSAADGQHELSGQGGVHLPVGLPAVWSICPALHCQRNLVGPCPHLSR